MKTNNAKGSFFDLKEKEEDVSLAEAVGEGASDRGGKEGRDQQLEELEAT